MCSDGDGLPKQCFGQAVGSEGLRRQPPSRSIHSPPPSG